MTNGGGFLGVPSVSATVTIKLSPSRAIITDTDVSATVCPNAVRKPVPAPVQNKPPTVVAPKVVVPPVKPQPVPQKLVTQKTPKANNNKFTPKPAPVVLIKRQSTEEESTDPLDSDLSEEEVEEIEEEEDDGNGVDEEESEEEESETEDVADEHGKIGGNVVRQRKEYELDDFQMIKTIGESFLWLMDAISYYKSKCVHFFMFHGG